MGKDFRLAVSLLTLFLVVPLTATSSPGAEATAATAHASSAVSAPPRAVPMLICDSTGLNCVSGRSPASPSPAPPSAQGQPKPGPNALAAPPPNLNAVNTANSTAPVNCENGEGCQAKAAAPLTTVASAPSLKSAHTALPAAGPQDRLPTTICDDSGQRCVTGYSAPLRAPEKLAALHPPHELAAPAGRSHGTTEGEILYDKATRAEDTDPSNWSVMAYKSQHILSIYFEGRLFARYRAVFGRSLQSGGKLYEGDRRTPEGAYRIIAKRPSYRWRYFLKLNYPNQVDRLRFDELREDGLIPARFREGGEIGIHGTDEPLLNEGLINWTTGCISVDNDTITELDRLLPIGTLVVIKP